MAGEAELIAAIGGAAGESGGGGGGDLGGGTLNFLGSSGDPLDTGWTMFNDIMGWVTEKRNLAEERRKFDMTFAENQRQFGLEFALKEFSTRKQLDLQEVRDMYNAKFTSGQLQNETARTRSALQAQAVEIETQQETFRWATEDREKSEKAARAYGRGLLQGFSGRT